ncbi:hypothetical protein HMPREF2586_00190 [Staphylococcus sp. HMSC034G07]|uniref:hypothetical protein n=1 Tax=Staphylococcus sp. HMSC034G07 TaxID=1715065 RepID=UPI0008A90ADC|nr:hypothetical protein [Staphylococcus sp. HMSC034G07]OHO41560.1 hypothetical protein HMPREF2586_00190 [Staphylococcus sp. HMSC034G07]
MTNNEKNFLNNYVSGKDESEKKETPMTKKKKTDYKMVKLNNEIHSELKMKSVQKGISMQEMNERALRKYLDEI